MLEIYKREIEKKIKEIKLLRELVALEETKSGFNVQKIFNINSKQDKNNNIFYQSKDLQNMDKKEIQDLLNNNICNISYVKKNSEDRQFKKVSFSKKLTDIFFKKHLVARKEYQYNIIYNNKLICFLEEKDGELNIKNILIDRIKYIEVLNNHVIKGNASN